MIPNLKHKSIFILEFLVFIIFTNKIKLNFSYKKYIKNMYVS